MSKSQNIGSLKVVWPLTCSSKFSIHNWKNFFGFLTDEISLSPPTERKSIFLLPTTKLFCCLLRSTKTPKVLSNQAKSSLYTQHGAADRVGFSVFKLMPTENMKNSNTDAKKSKFKVSQLSLPRKTIRQEVEKYMGRGGGGVKRERV